MACCGQKAHNSLIRRVNTTQPTTSVVRSGSSNMQSNSTTRHMNIINNMRIGRNK